MHPTSTKRCVGYGLAVLLALALALLSDPAAANPKYAGLVYDVIAEKTLYADSADAPRYPASLTKVMTLYLVFEELAAGRLSLSDKLTVSKHAAARPPSKIGLPVGGTITVRDAIKALVTKSANDVAVVVAEGLEGTEAAFARRMTRTAKRLGMGSTTFRNASGLPNAAQKTTARDMVRLGVAIQRDFPQYYGVFQTRTFTFGKRRYGNHNRLLGTVKGVDGIKTGYIRASGFNLITSVRRDGRHVVAVVMGGRTGASRNAHMRTLVERYLPKAEAGVPMVVAAWNDNGPPPLPNAKPSLRTLFADRLQSSPAQDDPLETLLAFAAETRASAGSATVGTPDRSQLALRAVIARGSPDQHIPPAQPSQTRDGADAASAPASRSDSAPADLAETGALAYATDAASGTSASAAVAGALGEGVTEIAKSSDPRLDAAFSVVEMVPALELDTDGVASAIRRAQDSAGIELVALDPYEDGETDAGRASATGERRAAGADDGAAEALAAVSRGDDAARWQIQLGAVADRDEAERLLAEAERAEPALKQRRKVTMPVDTGGGTLFRARFAGFHSLADARAVCQRFANNDRPCWAVAM